MPLSTPGGIGFADDTERYGRWNLHDPAARAALTAALCGEDAAFQGLIEVRGGPDSGKGYLLESAAWAAGTRGHPWVHAALDLDAASPDGVLAGDYLDQVLMAVRPGRAGRGGRRLRAIRGLFAAAEAKAVLTLPLSGWDRLAWLPLAIELELPLARIRDLFARHWSPDLKRPPPERFIETLREFAAAVQARRGGGGLLLQVQEQHQPEAGVRDLLLEALPSVPHLVLAFTQSETAPALDDGDLRPLRIGLEPLTAADLGARLGLALGAQALPAALLRTVSARAAGRPGEAARLLAELAAQGLIGPDPAGTWRLADDPDTPGRLDQVLGPGLYGPLRRVLEGVREQRGPESAAVLRAFLDAASLCGRNLPFGILATVLGLEDAGADGLLDLLDEYLVDPAEDADATAGPLLLHFGYRHPDFPDQEVFRFANPLLALHLRTRLSRAERHRLAGDLLARLGADLPVRNRGVAALHLGLLDHLGDEPRRRAVAEGLFYWIDAAQARAARRQLSADLRARRVAPESVWEAVERHGERWPVWRRVAWLEAYGEQPQGVPMGMRGVWLSRLTKALKEAGEYDRALVAARKLLAHFWAVEGLRSPNTAVALSSVGTLLLDLGRPEAGLKRLEKALAIERLVLADGDPAIAPTLNNIGAAFWTLGRYEEALGRYQEVLPIQRKASPGGHPDIATSLHNIAAALQSLGRHEEALEAGQEALTIRREVLPAGHPAIARSLHAIGVSLNALDRPAEALARFDESLLIQRRSLPAGHPEIAASYRDRGWVLTRLGRHAEARAAWEESFAIHSGRGAPPSTLVSFCDDCAVNMARNGDRDGARHWLTRALSLLPADPAPDPPDQAAQRAALERRLADLGAPVAGDGSPPGLPRTSIPVPGPAIPPTGPGDNP